MVLVRLGLLDTNTSVLQFRSTDLRRLGLYLLMSGVLSWCITRVLCAPRHCLTVYPPRHIAPICGQSLLSLADEAKINISTISWITHGKGVN